MKKLATIIVAVLFVSAFSSCRKCVECEVSYGGQTNTEKECYSSSKERKEKQKEADDACALIKAFGGTCECKAVL